MRMVGSFRPVVRAASPGSGHSPSAQRLFDAGDGGGATRANGARKAFVGGPVGMS